MADDRSHAEKQRHDEQGEESETGGSQGSSNGGGGQAGSDGHGHSFIGEVGHIIREAAMEVLGPATRELTSKAAKYAVQRGPELMSEKVLPAVEDSGGPGGLAGTAVAKAGKAVGKLAGGGGGKAATGWGHNRRMPVQQLMYVSVPVRQAFNGWTEYKQWPDFMHRVNQTDPELDDERVRVKVTEKMWGFTRPFTAEVLSQKPDEHIRWKSVEGAKHVGTINFHELGPRLTLIEVNVDHSPSGMIEKISRGARFDKRAIRADLHRFRGWIEMKSEDELEEMEGWRGTIEDGKVTMSHDDAVAQEQEESSPEDTEREQPSAESGEGEESEREGRDDEAYDEEPEQPEASEDEESEPEEPEAPEDGDESEPEASTSDEDESDDEEEPPQTVRRRPAQRRRARDTAEAAPRRRRTPAR